MIELHQSISLADAAAILLTAAALALIVGAFCGALIATTWRRRTRFRR